MIANQTVVQAEAAARSDVAKANGESQAIRWLSINRWNGQMPYPFGTDAFPLFQLPQAVLKQNQTT